MINNLKKNELIPLNLPETIIFYLAISTYPLYLIGATYIVVPLIGAGLAIYALWQWRIQTTETPLLERVFISPTAWVWLIAGLITELAMIVGHFNFDLGFKLMVFTTINNWYRRWAIIPLFILVGHLFIRPKLMYRLGCIIAIEAATVIVVGTILASLGIPKIDYISPLSVFGGGPDHYHIYLFENALEGRVNTFTPWSTALGTVGNFCFFLAGEEKAKRWRTAGIISSLTMVIASQSRAALLCIPFVLIVVWLSRNIHYPQVQLISSFACFMLGIFSFQISKIINFAQEQFTNFRGKDSLHSSRTRSILYRMTIKGWWHDAPIWGHGRLPEAGPRLVGEMPVGSHNTWLGGLYTFGLVGFMAIAIASLFTFFNLIVHARKSPTVKVGLCLSITLFISTFTENVEYVSYVYWSGLLFIGIALRHQQEEIESNQQLARSKMWQID